MSTPLVVAISGIKALDSVADLDQRVVDAARMAVNAAVKKGRILAARSMEKQIHFPPGYLTSDRGRLSIAKLAMASDLEARLRGRDRPTSLARFIVGGAKVGRGQKGVSVEVDPGMVKFMSSAFAIKLRNDNIGLAYRGKEPPKSHGAKQLGPNLWLLYGPSVDQVFNRTREYVRDDIEEFMNDEFNRLLELDL